MKKTNIIWIALIAVVILIQLIPSGRPETTMKNENDLLVNGHTPDSVSVLLRNACYNCHSNETSYPWYSYVAPVSWKISSDVRDAREVLNFSEWNTYDKLDKIKVLGDIGDEVREKDMPLSIYSFMHAKARLTDKQREILENWSEQLAGALL